MPLSLWHLASFLALSFTAAPVPKGPAVAPPPHPLIQFRALSFTDVPHRPGLPDVEYVQFDTAGPKEGTSISIHPGVKHLTVDPQTKIMYGIHSQRIYVVPVRGGGWASLKELKLPANLTKLSWPCGITFDTKRERVVLVSLGGKGFMYTYGPKTDKWLELTDMNNLDLVGFTYCARADVLYGLYEAHDRMTGQRAPRLGIFDPATGALKDEIALTSPALPTEFGRARGNECTVQLASVGNHVLMLTDKQLFRLDLATKKITVEWTK